MNGSMSKESQMSIRINPVFQDSHLLLENPHEVNSGIGQVFDELHIQCIEMAKKLELLACSRNEIIPVINLVNSGGKETTIIDIQFPGAYFDFSEILCNPQIRLKFSELLGPNLFHLRFRCLQIQTVRFLYQKQCESKLKTLQCTISLNVLDETRPLETFEMHLTFTPISSAITQSGIVCQLELDHLLLSKYINSTNSPHLQIQLANACVNHLSTFRKMTANQKMEQRMLMLEQNLRLFGGYRVTSTQTDICGNIEVHFVKTGAFMNPGNNTKEPLGVIYIHHFVDNDPLLHGCTDPLNDCLDELLECICSLHAIVTCSTSFGRVGVFHPAEADSYTIHLVVNYHQDWHSRGASNNGKDPYLVSLFFAALLDLCIQIKKEERQCPELLKSSKFLTICETRARHIPNIAKCVKQIVCTSPENSQLRRVYSEILASEMADDIFDLLFELIINSTNK